jgi:YidC/Oxa1 family membrane protein insertase
MVIVAVFVGWAIWRANVARQQRPGSVPAPAQPAPASAPLAGTDEQLAPAAPESPPPPGPNGGLPVGTLRALPAQWIDPTPIGSVEKSSGYLARVRFSRTGAGLSEIALTQHFDTILEEHHILVQREHVLMIQNPEGPARVRVLTPMSLLAAEVSFPDGKVHVVNLAGGGEKTPWEPVPGSPGVFQARIVDDSDSPILTIRREWSIEPGSHIVRLKQHLTNHSGTAVKVRLYQMGPVDLDQDALGYGGDKRRVRMGYLLSPRVDPTRAAVIADAFILERSAALGDRDANGTFTDRILWPNEESVANGFELAWVGLTNRYYGTAVYAPIEIRSGIPDKHLRWVEKVSRVVLDGGQGHEQIGLRLESAPLAIEPGTTRVVSASMFAGPLSRATIKAEPEPAAMGLPDLVIYNFGGPCGFCTFSVVTDALIWLLRALHDNVFHDWSLAVIVLVVIVRTCLHPVTRWSQIRMAIFGKQMQALAPKQKEIQEKFRGDPKRIQQETQRLWQEEGISPAGFLGCLPAFLQTPIWIALYATLYFAVELRHEPAFYGLFQSIQPRSLPTWRFLGDLAESDRFLYFGRILFTVPLLGPIDSINLLPILLGVVFFIQQKYLTPPTTSTLTPEQEMQQTMMKWMMVIMFPVFMYNAPSALSLYFLTNSTLAIIESKWIRAHMDRHGMLDLDKLKALRAARLAAGTGTWDRGNRKTPHREGFFARLQRLAEEKQRESQRQKRKR